MYPELAASGRYVSGSNKIYTTSVRSPPPYSQVSAGSIKIATAPPSYAQIVGVREINWITVLELAFVTVVKWEIL